MNRLSVLLLCLTTLAIFFILRQDNVKVDVDAYEAQISIMNSKLEKLYQVLKDSGSPVILEMED